MTGKDGQFVEQRPQGNQNAIQKSFYHILDIAGITSFADKILKSASLQDVMKCLFGKCQITALNIH